MTNKKLLSLYSLKFNPFSPEVPTSALWSAPSIESFCWRIEQQIGEGGFALATLISAVRSIPNWEFQTEQQRPTFARRCGRTRSRFGFSYAIKFG
jgi:hypothetical protein